MSEGQKPSVGRIVHFFTTESWPYQVAGRANAAIVTHMHEDGMTVNLTVFTKSGVADSAEDIPARAGASPLQTKWWEWPPRV